MLSGIPGREWSVIASVTYDMGAPIVKKKRSHVTCHYAGSFPGSCILEINVIYIVIVCGLLGVGRTLLSPKRRGRRNDLSAIIFSAFCK